MPNSILANSGDLSRTKMLWLMCLSLLFVVANIIFISLGFYYFSLVPAGLLLVLFSLLSLEKTFFILVFLTPLSIQLKEFWPDLSMNLYLPTEPLLFLMLLLFIIKLVREQSFPKQILRHPVSLAIYFYLIWIFITSINSTLPIVSLKFLLSRLWFISIFYFLAVIIFKNPKKIIQFIAAYGLGLLFVVVYALINLSRSGFIDQQAAHSAPNPFYSDHTSYGAILALILPASIGIALKSKLSNTARFIVWFTIALFAVALFFSYSRAAWISVLGAIGIFIIVKLKIRFSILLMFSVLSFLFLFFYWGELKMKLEDNRQDSSSDFSQHVQSISNVSSDASNLERINRWGSAIRMFREKPLFGWGPGTYMFQYAGFQSSRNRTIISTNFGDGGNAHSEYLGPLAESGILGAVSFILILVSSIATGIRYYQHQKISPYRWITLALVLGLTTYILHGFLNNFLDTDKASALFWGFIAALVALDIFQKEPERESI